MRWQFRLNVVLTDGTELSGIKAASSIVDPYLALMEQVISSKVMSSPRGQVYHLSQLASR